MQCVEEMQLTTGLVLLHRGNCPVREMSGRLTDDQMLVQQLVGSACWVTLGNLLQYNLLFTCCIINLLLYNVGNGVRGELILVVDFKYRTF